MNLGNLSIEYWSELSDVNIKLYRVNNFSWLESKTKDSFFNSLFELPCTKKFSELDFEIIDKFFKFGIENDVTQNIWIEEPATEFYKSKLVGLMETVCVKTLCLKNIGEIPYSDEKDISVYQVKSLEDLQRWFFVFKESFSLSREGQLLFFNVFSKNLENKKFKHFFLEFNKSIVSVLTLMYNKDHLSLYNFATISKFRKRGYLTNLLANVLSQVSVNSKIYVQANPSSLSLLKNIGFAEEKNYVIYRVKT